jgi:LysM repeat protein
VHRVNPGDTISGISQFYDVSVKVILELNGISDVDNIFVGQELRLPPDARMPLAATAPATYRVQSGDTLSAIAVKFGVSIEILLSVNGLKDANSIFEGQEIRLSSGT